MFIFLVHFLRPFGAFFRGFIYIVHNKQVSIAGIVNHIFGNIVEIGIDYRKVVDGRFVSRRNQRCFLVNKNPGRIIFGIIFERKLFCTPSFS